MKTTSSRDQETPEQNRNARIGKTDGRLFPVLRQDVVNGAVLRMVTPSDGSVPAFSDFVVLKVDIAVEEGDVPEVTLGRPYAYATKFGNILTGTEVLHIPVERLLAKDSLFRSVVQSTGLVATHHAA